MTHRLLLFTGEAAADGSADARTVAGACRLAGATLATTHLLDSARQIARAAAASGEGLLLVIDPDVASPLSLARRLVSEHGDLRCVVTVTAAREAPLRREAVYGLPAGGRASIERVDDPALAARIAQTLASAEQQRRLRTTLDRAQRALTAAPAVSPREYHRLVVSDRTLATVLRNAQDAIVSVDHEGRVLSWNKGAETVFGLSEAQARQTLLAEQFGDSGRFQQLLDTACAGRRAHAEFVLRRDGADVYLDAVFDVTRAESSDQAGAVVILRDTTERRIAEEELRRGSRQKDEFLAMLAHELRNPLAPIRNAAHILTLPGLDERRTRKATDIIARQVAHLTGLVDDLLDVARVTRGAVDLDRRPVSLAAVLADAVEQARELIDARQHALSLHMSPEAGDVDGDSKRLVQVFANILHNSAKYTPPGGHIDVTLSVAGDQRVVTIADDGRGIDPALLPHVFDLFSQGQRSAHRPEGGLGVGLSLVRTLVSLHGGDVQVHSDGLGKGTRTVVTLPGWTGAVPSPEPADTRRADQLRAGNRLNLTVVDDNADAAHTLATLLQAEGHSVSVEVDPRQALMHATGSIPDVYILDIGMPFIDGYELARRLRALPQGARPLLVALTGYGQRADRERALAAGFDHHLVKPLDLAALTTLLDTVDLSRRH